MDELDKLLSHSFEDIINDSILLRELFRLSENLLHLPYKTCPGTHRRYYERLKQIKNKPMKNKVNLLDKKYILKPGKSLYYNNTHFHNEGEVLSSGVAADKAHTLTDQIAANAIKRFPGLVGAFLSERERAILEAKDKAHHDISDAENALNDEQKVSKAPKAKAEKKKVVKDQKPKELDKK